MEPFYGEWQRHWQTAQDQGVVKSIVVGADVASSQRAIEISDVDQNLYAAVGIHPDTWQNSQDFSAIEEIGQLVPHRKIVAIGEVGLDYFHIDGDRETVIAVQKTAFQKQVQLAMKHNLPLILHVRDKQEQAYWDTLEILKKEKFTQKFVLHCVSGPREYVQQAVEMGAYIGIAGNVTYKNADHIRGIVTATPTDRLLLETDAPFLPPQEFRGQICEPWMIVKTAEFLEKELRISLESLVRNALTVF